MEDVEGTFLQGWDRWDGEDILIKLFRFIMYLFVIIILLVVLIYNLGWGKGLIYSAIIIAGYTIGSFKHEIFKFIKKIFKVKPKIKFGKLKA